MKAITIGFLLALAGCSSGGGTRPIPPPTLHPATVEWTEVQQDTNGDTMTDIANYQVTYQAAGREPTSVWVPADRRALTVQLPSGRWDFSVVANSATLGPGEAGRATRDIL